MGPKCGPGDRLSNAEVSSKSGQWRPDWWQKCVLKKTQEPTILGANYSNRKVTAQHTFQCRNNFGSKGRLHPLAGHLRPLARRLRPLTGRLRPLTRPVRPLASPAKRKMALKRVPRTRISVSTPELAIVFRGESVSGHPGARGGPKMD